MENKASQIDERKLANAIERAATVASINDKLDRNTLLAEQLKKASVDPKFAKTASAAFNKRITVLTFKKTADEHKADPFQLTDADTVYRLVTGEEPETKVAAAEFTMSLEDLTDTMEKAASAKSVDRRYENTVGMETYLEHVESMMDKYAFALEDLFAVKSKLEARIDKQAADVAGYFQNKMYDYDFTTAVNLYGDKLKEAMDGYLTDVRYEKTANFVVRPQREIFKKVAKLMEDREALEGINAFLDEFSTGITEFCKSASDLGEEYLLKKADLLDDLQNASYDVMDADQAYQDAKTVADTGRGHGIEPVITGIGNGTLAMLPTAAGAAYGTANDIFGATKTLLDNAKAKYYAGNNVSISPADLLDAAFLTKDRYRDRLLAWSDMSADPQLAMYPAEQVFQATQKAMDMDTSMERPDQRELLRAQVSQLLAQNNRASTADIAALATTLKALAGGRQSAVTEAADAVSGLSDKTAPEPVKSDSILGGETKGLDMLRDELLKETDGAYDTLEGDKADLQKQLDDAVKERGKERDAAIKRLQSLRDEQEKRDTAAEQKQLSDEQKRQQQAAKDQQQQINDALGALGLRRVVRGNRVEFKHTDPNTGKVTYHGIPEVQRSVNRLINAVNSNKLTHPDANAIVP